MKTILLIICFSLSLISCRQANNNSLKFKEESVKPILNDSLNLEEQNARTLLNYVLTDSSNQNDFIDTKRKNINDKKTAIDAVEPILFNGYGKDNIIKQRPYKVYFIDNYWIIEGIQKEIEIGGTFKLVLDSKTGRIIYITHGK
jgi:hypothetical protein